MAFLARNYERGRALRIPAVGSATAITKGDSLKNSSGYLTPSASGDNSDTEFVAIETVTTGSSNGDTLVHCIPVRGVQFVADTSNTPTQAQALVYVDLSAAGTVDTSAVTDQVFYFARSVGALADKKIIGWFSCGVPNS